MFACTLRPLDDPNYVATKRGYQYVLIFVGRIATAHGNGVNSLPR